jgi:hypothetical protein
MTTEKPLVYTLAGEPSNYLPTRPVPLLLPFLLALLVFSILLSSTVPGTK